VLTVNQMHPNKNNRPYTALRCIHTTHVHARQRRPVLQWLMLFQTQGVMNAQQFTSADSSTRIPLTRSSKPMKYSFCPATQHSIIHNLKNKILQHFTVLYLPNRISMFYKLRNQHTRQNHSRPIKIKNIH
jgi:hypothetical protein